MGSKTFYFRKMYIFFCKKLFVLCVELATYYYLKSQRGFWSHFQAGKFWQAFSYREKVIHEEASAILSTLEITNFF